MKKIYCSGLLLVLFFVVACAPTVPEAPLEEVSEADLPPEPKAPGSIVPLAGKAYTDELRLAGYADPTGYFSISPDPVVSLWSPDLSILQESRVEKDQLVYRYGYKTDKNGKWRKFEYSCSEGCSPVRNSNWLRLTATGKATRSFIISLADYDLAEANYLLAYACSRNPITKQFNCHDNKWMAHEFRVDLTNCNNADDNCPDGYGCEADPSDATKSYCLPLPEDVVCGNGIVDAGENCATCALDVSCTAGEVCSVEGLCTVSLGEDWSTDARDYVFYEDCEDLPNSGWVQVSGIDVTDTISKEGEKACVIGDGASSLMAYGLTDDDDTGTCFGAWVYFGEKSGENDKAAGYLYYGDGGGSPFAYGDQSGGRWYVHPAPYIVTDLTYTKPGWYFTYFCQPEANLWHAGVGYNVLRIVANAETNYFRVSGYNYWVDGIRGWNGRSILDMPKVAGTGSMVSTVLDELVYDSATERTCTTIQITNSTCRDCLVQSCT
ncbi:MAG TPA: hypothetical protein VJC21_01770 [Candidatus Nanoarchaeia archaeon]|nr:hypothetical protein [Candidatus Nanoarchaeia archaeon]